MKVISVNVNGIRAAERKGFFTWIEKLNPDVVCLQELKAQEDQLAKNIFYPEVYNCYYFPAERKGYSGVGIYSKVEPEQVTTGLGWFEADQEGRYIQADFANLSIASLYLPSGSSSEERQEVKFDFLDRYMQQLKKIRDAGREFIICGDWNIAHKKIDIKNWRGNKKNSGELLWRLTGKNVVKVSYQRCAN